MLPHLRHRSRRYACAEVFVIFDTHEAYISAPVVDMSQSGVQVASDEPVRIGSHVEVVFETGREDPLPLGVPAQVVWCRPYADEPPYGKRFAVALRFLYQGAEEQVRVARFLGEHGLPLTDPATSDPVAGSSFDRDAESVVGRLLPSP